MKNIIVSGCSYSTNTGAIPYSSILKKSSNIEISNISWPGYSNDSIIRAIEDEIKSGITDTLFICQLTHLHRVSYYCSIGERWLDFQPQFINISPQIKDDSVIFEVDTDNVQSGKSKGIVSKNVYDLEDINLNDNIYQSLIKFYQTYLKYLYDDTISFNTLMDKIDYLIYKVKKSNNKILFLYWPHIIPNLNELKNRNFFNIDGEYSLLNWSTKNNLLDGRTSHLSQEGHKKLSELILKQLNLQKNNYI